MNEERVTLATLRKLLAAKTSIPERKVGEFLNVLFRSIVEGLRTDGLVRVNGLGTFKVQWNAPRKSVNVQTGEAIVIDGYNKVVFAPEANLKNRVNEPFAHLESIVIGENSSDTRAETDPMQKFGEQAEEIKDLLAELGVVKDEPLTPEQEELQHIPTAENSSDNVTEEVGATDVTETLKELVTTDLQATTEKAILKEPEKDDKPSSVKEIKTKPFHPWKVAGITILCFCVLLVGGYFFLQHKITAWADSLLDKEGKDVSEEVQLEPIGNAVDTILAVDSVSSSDLDTTQAQSGVIQEDVPADTVGCQEWVYTDFITTETLTEGSRLTWLSRKYYGAPDFWVYIYEANKDIIPDPNNISVGTQLRIPRLPKEMIDVKNEASMRQAKELHNAILKDF